MKFEDCVCDTIKNAAAKGLLALMCAFSEDYWSAGWYMGFEVTLWDIRKGRKDRGRITERQVRLLIDLSEEAGGWWMWSEDETQQPVFIPLGDMGA